MDGGTNTDQSGGAAMQLHHLLQGFSIQEDRWPCDRQNAYRTFMAKIASLATQDEVQTPRWATMHASHYYPSTTSLAQLKATKINELNPQKNHRGHYLLLRAITPPLRTEYITVLAEDENEDVVLLNLFHQEDESVRKASDIVDVDTVLLVKEPFLTVTDGETGVRVDHVSDLVSVGDYEPMMPRQWLPNDAVIQESFEETKSKGDAAFREGEFWKAIKLYSRALTQNTPPERNEIIRRNRALAYLKTSQFDAALIDTGFPVFSHPLAEKALYRSCEALYSLGRFAECRIVLKKLCSEFPDSREGRILFERVQKRCMEKSHAAYNFSLLQRMAKTLNVPILDLSTYMGPLKVQKSPGKGRGLFLTKSVKAGDLLLCEKALACVFKPEDRNPRSAGSPDAYQTLSGHINTQMQLTDALIWKVKHNPSIRLELASLHCGSYAPLTEMEVDGKPVVDTFAVEYITGLNRFNMPLSSLNDVKKTISPKDQLNRAPQSCGIWRRASYINHSCINNAIHSFIGDMMIVRAARDIEAGAEITIWYTVPDGEAEKQGEKTDKWFFNCTCAICVDLAKTGKSALAQRRKLKLELDREMLSISTRKPSPRTLTRILRRLENTYSRPAEDVPRVMLWPEYWMLASIYSSQKQADKVLEATRNYLRVLGFTVEGLDSTSTAFKILKWGLVMNFTLEMLLRARTIFANMEHWSDAQTTKEYAKLVYKMVVGEDETFEETCKNQLS